MMRGYLLIAIFFLGLGQLEAQPVRDTAWKKAGYFGLKLTQVSLSSWSAGGESAVSFDSQITYTADFKRDRQLWLNRLELAYGLTKSEGEGSRKTNDKIYMASTFGYQIYKSLYWSTLFNFNTQFAKGYDYSIEDSDFISKFMAPGYVLVGTGITWIPNKIFTLTFAPASWRGTIVANDRLSDQGAFGVDKGKHLLSEFGANLKAEVNYEFLQNMTVYSRLELYSNYLKDPQNVDINWEVQINMAINKWFSTTLSTNLLYDNDVKIVQKDGTAGPRVQFKEVLGVGLQVHF